MAGVFQDLIEVVNRAPWPLSVRFDGQETTLQPGKNFIPSQTLLYVLNQNPMLGTHDPYNPNVAGGEYLIGVVGKEKKYPCTPLTKAQIELQRNNPSRYDYVDMLTEKLGKHDKIEVRGRKATSRSDVKLPALVGTDRND